MKSYVKVRTDLELENRLLYRRLRLKDHDVDTYQFVVSVKYRSIALDLLHDQFGHLGIDKTTALSCERFFWPKMAEEIRSYIQNCERCLRHKQKPEWAELKPLEASYPSELVHMDYLKIGGKDDPNSNVLVITDHFTCTAKLMSRLINKLPQQLKYSLRSLSTIMGGQQKYLLTKVRHSMANYSLHYVKRPRYSN